MLSQCQPMLHSMVWFLLHWLSCRSPYCCVIGRFSLKHLLSGHLITVVDQLWCFEMAKEWQMSVFSVLQKAWGWECAHSCANQSRAFWFVGAAICQKLLFVISMCCKQKKRKTGSLDVHLSPPCGYFLPLHPSHSWAWLMLPNIFDNKYLSTRNPELKDITLLLLNDELNL